MAKTPAEVYEEFLVPTLFTPCSRLLLAAAAPRPGERVLDLACGTGVVARQVAPLVGEGGAVTGVDLRPGMLAVAAAASPSGGAAIEWRQGDALALELPEASFDLLLCQQGLQFFPDRAKAVREMRRVLKPGGRAVIASWCGFASNVFFGDLAQAEAKHLETLGATWDDLEAPFTLGDGAALRALFDGAGFRDVAVRPSSFQARAPAAGFVRMMELAYASIVPSFVEDPAAFERFVAAVERDASELLQRHTVGHEIVFDLHLNLCTALA